MFADVSLFFQLPMAEPALIGGRTVLGHFDLDAADLFGGHYSGTGPTFECAAADVAGIVPGADVVIRGIAYKVRPPIRPQGDGAIAYLTLEAQ